MAIYNDILDAVVSQIQTLGLTLGSTSVVVAKRKLPKREQGLDTLPLIAVVPSDKPETVKRLGFEDAVSVTYRVDVVVIATGDGDPVSNLDTYLDWRQKIRRLFQEWPLAGVDSVYDVRIDPDTVIDRDALNQNYDYSGLTAWFLSAEQSTN